MGNNGTAGTNDGTPGSFSAQGLAIYNKIKSKPNVVMMLGGHVMGNGEGFRQDVYNGHTIKTFLCDYQARTNLGNGIFRLMKFNTATDKISITTFSPYLNPDYYENDGDSKFTVPLFLEQTATRNNDFDDDGKTNYTLFSNGNWYSDGLATVAWGITGDIPIPGDYDGNGEIDYTIFRPGAIPKWYIKGQSTVDWGLSGDIPVPADYDGDGNN